INREWCTKFPFLYLSFVGSTKWDVTHASIRAKKDSNGLKTTASMNVSTFERRYKEAFGKEIEIKYIKNGRNYRSLGEHNNLTLSEFNSWAKENGCAEIIKTHPEWF
ncbi:MAG: hypothetical protein ACK5D8_05645, partial [Bacteroidota bacterium]